MNALQDPTPSEQAEEAALARLWRDRFQTEKPADHFQIVRDILQSNGVSPDRIEAAVSSERRARGLE